MRVLITGGAGFIGSHIAEFYLDMGDEVWVVDNFSTGKKENITGFMSNPLFRYSEADLFIWGELDKAVQWAHKVYHLAAIVGQKSVLKDALGTLSINIALCERVLRAVSIANPQPRLLLLSSSEVYDASCRIPFSEENLISFPLDDYLQQSYRLSKFVNEKMALCCAVQKNVSCIVIRLFNTIGTRQSGRYGMVVPSLVQQAISHQPMTVFGNGRQTRSFSYVNDVVKIFHQLMEMESQQLEIVNVGSEEEISILHLAQLIKKKTNSKSEIIFVPYEQAYGVDYSDLLRRKPDLSKLMRLIGVQTTHSLDKTLDKIIEAFT